MQFLDALEAIRPHILIGATAAPNTFTREAVERMCAINDRPVIFALSNPTSKAECTAEEAYTWSNGKAVFASGSPFDEVHYKGQIFKSGQGNNAYIFPGVGLGAIISKAKCLKDDIFLTAARTLAQIVSQDNIDKGSLYPQLREIRRVSLEIAIAVSEKIYHDGLARAKRPDELGKTIVEYMFDPRY
jgi:malate dehydrogenase (oxaloacetate-decarboxylating)(NADP+)